MADTCPVVRIKSDNPSHPDGFVEINEEDFNKEIHELWDSVVKAVRTSVDWTIAEFKAALTDMGVEFDPKAKRDELAALHAAAVAPQPVQDGQQASEATQQPDAPVWPSQAAPAAPPAPSE